MAILKELFGEKIELPQGMGHLDCFIRDTRVTVLTPPGAGAIATVEIAGPGAWAIVHRLFRPRGKTLPDAPELHRFWFGDFGTDPSDEVILAVTAVEPEPRLEVHCHGGPRIVRWVVDQLEECGAIMECGVRSADRADPWRLLTRAPTLRTAAILLDQAHGALAKSVRHIADLLERDPMAALKTLRELTQYEHCGRHLIEPWKVVVAGAPNVGKSSLVNSLAGYGRTVVSEVAGTTRDAVTVSLAFDGWPVDITDTAGLRAATGLEAEGIERTHRALREADLIVWVMDPQHRDILFAEVDANVIIKLSVSLCVMNKSDLLPEAPVEIPPGALCVSALTGAGIPELIAAVVDRLVVNTPPAGAAMPYTADLADALLDVQRAPGSVPQ